MIKRFFLATAVLMLLTGTVLATDPITLKWGTFAPSPAWENRLVFGPWVEKANKIAPDTVQFKFYVGGTLGKNPMTYFKLVQDGVMDIGFLMNPYKPGRFADDVIANFPYLSDNGMDPTLAYIGLYKKGLLRGYDDLYPFALMTTHQNILSTNFPVNKPDDLKGKKIRASSKIQFEYIKAFGATPVPIPITKAAESISRGVIQGCIADPAAMLTFRVDDVAKYHLIIPLGCVPIQLGMSKKRFNTLPEGVKRVIEKHAGEKISRSWAYHNEAIIQKALTKWQNDPKQTVFIPTPEQHKEWKARMMPVLEAWTKESPRNAALLKAYKEELSKVKK